MSDFIFTKKNVEKKEITSCIRSIYKKDPPHINEFHGNWGSLGVSENLYNGFDPYEDENYIAILVGGPILTFRDNQFIKDHDFNNYNSEGTQSVLNRWKSNNMSWDEDLSGPYVVLIINKKTQWVTCVTDLMSFIPVYYYQTAESVMLSTHVDALALITEQTQIIDNVSQVDFILHNTVTFPYTSYKNILQLSPATKHHANLNEIKSYPYWLPEKTVGFKSLSDAAKELQEVLKTYVKKITNEAGEVAQFISGGEDSRIIASLLKNSERDAFIFLDQMNREGELAKEAASAYGANFKLSTRNPLYYLDILTDCSRLVGSGSQYRHAHTYGFHKTCCLNSYSAVFGGLFADALLKGSHVKKVKRSGKLPFFPEIKDKNYSAYETLNNYEFNSDIINELAKRRHEHLEYVKRFRGESADEWFELWPSSMNRSLANLHVNRRLFKSYEPFLSNKVVKISASVPQKWKLNRKLFHRMAKPLLEETKWLKHGNGWFPYYSWQFNSFISFLRMISNKFSKNKGNQGSWEIGRAHV